MHKFTYIVLLLLTACFQAHAVNDCQIGKESISYKLIKNSHTVVYPVDEICKPQL